MVYTGAREKHWLKGWAYSMRVPLSITSMASRPLQLELLVAAFLLMLALGWEGWRHVGLWPALHWSFWCLPWGILATLPPLLMILLLESRLCQRLGWLREFRQQVTTL